MDILKKFKKKVLNTKLDPKYQYVESPTFFWNVVTKKVGEIPIINSPLEANLFFSQNKNLERRGVRTWEIKDEYTYDDFLKQHNYHHLVFFLYDGGIFWPSNPEDDYLKYNSWHTDVTYPKNTKQIRVYVEEDIKKLRKEKLQKIKENIN